MKKLFFTLILFFSFAFGYSQNLKGTYLTEEYNTQSIQGLIRVTYEFTNDSLYIDAYPSGCNIASMSLEHINDYDYKAIDTIYDIDTGNVIKKFIYHISFLPCIWDKESIAVYRDNQIVDIIKKISK